MKTWLIDTYTTKAGIVLWLKTPEENIRLVQPFQTSIYVLDCYEAKKALNKHSIPCEAVTKRNYLRKNVSVLEVQVPHISQHKQFVSFLERITHYRIPFYNADTTPEQLFLYQHELLPCSEVVITKNKVFQVPNGLSTTLSKAIIKVIPKGDRNSAVQQIKINDTVLLGDEISILGEFCALFTTLDPDVVVMEHGYSRLPYLVSRLEKYSLQCSFHRWDALPIVYKGGKSFYTYGQVRYRNFAINLRGRFLIDTNSMVGDVCDVEGIIEICQLTGARFQTVASRSFGAAFQAAVVRELLHHNFLVPYKEKPIEKPITLFELAKSDRAGHTLDPKVGFHTQVAEIDFSSLYPWIMYNYNISADTILSNDEPTVDVPGIPVTISQRHKGLVPLAIKPILDRRMEYKSNPTALNKARAIGLKWILVTCYGYQRFREFKLGLGSSHAAICAYAREIMLSSVKLAEHHGYDIIHGIIDSLYLHKKNLSESEVKEFCKELYLETGIPVSFEGIFKWIVFLPSINDPERPVPARYYGVFTNGTIKARGIEIRQQSAPLIVKLFQEEVLQDMAKCSTQPEILRRIPEYIQMLRKTIKSLSLVDAKTLAIPVRIGKSDYKHNIPQKEIVHILKSKGITVMPGQMVKYVHQNTGVCLPEDYNGKPNRNQYIKLLTRSLFILLEPFGVKRNWIISRTEPDLQMNLLDFITPEPYPYETFINPPDNILIAQINNSIINGS